MKYILIVAGLMACSYYGGMEYQKGQTLDAIYLECSKYEFSNSSKYDRCLSDFKQIL